MIPILSKKGFKITILDTSNNTAGNIKYSTSLKEVIGNADIVIAPMSSTDQNGYLKATFDGRKLKLDQGFFELMNKKALFIIGIARTIVKDKLEENEIQYIELARLDEVAILNAIPTAEAAIKIAIEETDFTIHGSTTLVMGLGRIGLPLAWRLKQLGAISLAITRDREAIARGKDLGISMNGYDNLEKILPEVDIVFNTVPARILTKEYINLLKKESLIIDLASTPGGTDFDAAEKRGIKALLALGLPGKYAPKTAGKIIADVIPEIIQEHFKGV